MLDYVPITHHELCFQKGKKLPLYVYYTLLGQEYETLRNDDFLLERCGQDPEYVLDVLHTALSGFPEHDTVFPDEKSRVFNVRYCDNNDMIQLARVCFYIDKENDTLCCNIQRGHYGKDCSESCTHIEYESGYRMSWDWDDLDFYGLLNYNEGDFDD